MRRRVLGFVLFMGAVGLAPLTTARAQFGYGFGGFGWGGFSAASGYGMEAAGFGNLAAGMGSYNLQTAQGRAINVNTNMNLNEYMYESIRQRDARIQAARRQREQATNEALAQNQDRLRNNPTQADIYSGDALNMALTELSDPRYSAMVGQYASAMKITGRMIRQIPFNKASAAVTFGLGKLTGSEPGPIFSMDLFKDDVAEYRRLAASLAQQAEEKGECDPEDVKKFRALIQGAIDKVRGLTGVDPTQRATALTRAKALLGLSYMLDGPSIDILTAELRGDEQIGFDRLLSFMRSFNLRFGQATNPNTRQLYDELFPMLVQLRNDVFGTGTGTLLTDPPREHVDHSAVEKFFAGIPEEELHPNKERTLPKPPPPQGE